MMYEKIMIAMFVVLFLFNVRMFLKMNRLEEDIIKLGVNIYIIGRGKAGHVHEG